MGFLEENAWLFGGPNRKTHVSLVLVGFGMFFFSEENIGSPCCFPLKSDGVPVGKLCFSADFSWNFVL